MGSPKVSLLTLMTLEHSESIEQLAFNEVYFTIHFVSSGAHRAALAAQCANLARTARHHQMYQREDFNKKILL